VGQPVMSVKTAPVLGAETTTNTTTSSSSEVSTSSKPEPVTLAPNQIGDAPTFAAAPEQPAARPKPSPSTIAMMAPKPVAPPVTPPTHTVTRSTTTETTSKLDPSLVEAAGMTRASDATGTIKLAQAGKPKHVVTNAVSEEDDAVATPTKPMKVPSAKPVVAKSEAETGTTGATGGSVVQIGAFSSTALADTGYADVSKALAGRMSGKSKHVLPVTTANGKTLFRTWVAGFPSRADATAFCEALKAKNKTCIVKG
ncbi:MAG: SPOR domain-containing protein, partial [Caulobacteraceae bacterium]